MTPRIRMVQFRTVYNGTRIVTREVKGRKPEAFTEKLTGGTVMRATATPAPPIEDKKALRRRMAQELMRTL